MTATPTISTLQLEAYERLFSIIKNIAASPLSATTASSLAMGAVWPEKVLRQFQTILLNPLGADFHGAYNKLLNTLFPPDSDFTVVPQYLKPSSTLTSESIVTFEIFLENRPVLMLELKTPGDLNYVSTRETADSQIRQRMVDLVATCPIPTLHAISAIGTALCFYSLETQNPNAEIKPLNIARHPTKINDTAPKDRWNFDVVSSAAAAKLREVVEEVKEACERL